MYYTVILNKEVWFQENFKCSILFDDQNIDINCVAPIMIYNTFLFAIIYLWLCILILTIVLSFFYRISFLFPPVRKLLFKSLIFDPILHDDLKTICKKIPVQKLYFLYQLHYSLNSEAYNFLIHKAAEYCHIFTEKK